MNFPFFVLAAFTCVVWVEGARIVEYTRSARNIGKNNFFNPIGMPSIQQGLTRLAGMADLEKFEQFSQVGDCQMSAKGVQRCRAEMEYHGLQVYGVNIEYERDTTNQITGHFYGHVAHGIAYDVPNTADCSVPENWLLKQAAKAEGYNLNSDITERQVKKFVWLDPVTDEATLAYEVQFLYSGSGNVSRPIYFINACTRDVIKNYDQVQSSILNQALRVRRQATTEEQCDTTPQPTPGPTQPPTQPPTGGPTGGPGGACDPAGVKGIGGNQKTGRTDYDNSPFCLAVQKSGNTCTMSNKYAKVIDNQNSRSTSQYQDPIEFNCDEGYSDPINGAFGVASDAMYFGTVTGALYEEKYGIRALPYAPRLVIHYGSCYDNAFWNGVDMFFGDGCNYFYPLVNQDVVTHELGHGITSRNSRLIYDDQSGGINEAFSDISGEVAELFGRNRYDWMTGYELFKQDRPLRYFINPPDDGVSIKHVDDYDDSIDVHYSSGIYNHAFYQLVEIQGMPMYDAYKCFLQANLVLWGQNTGFQAGACNVMQACYDEGFDVNKVKAAFNVVGVDLSSCNYNALAVTLTSGSTMPVKASASRKPIFEVDGSVTYINAVAAHAVTVCSCDEDLCGTPTACAAGSAYQVNGASHVIIYTDSTEDETVSVAPN